MRRQRAFTLVEILVVCSLLAIIMGMGAAFLGSLNRVMAVKAEAGRLDALLRQAHNSASLEHAKAWVVLDPDTNQVHVRAMTTVGLWHFEDEEMTGYPPGQDVTLGSARLSDPRQDEYGKIGRCLVFGGGRGGADFGTDHLFDSPDGVAVEAWIFPYRESNCTLFQKGKGLKLSLAGQYIEGTVLGVGTVGNSWSGRKDASARRKLTVPVPVGRWSRVGLHFDGMRLELRVNGALAGQWPPPVKKKRSRKGRKRKDDEPRRFRYKADETAPLLVGRGFHGRLDELRVSAVVRTLDEKLDNGVAIDTERSNALSIHFAPGGWLDEEFHRETVRIFLVMRADPEKFELLEISRLGTIR